MDHTAKRAATALTCLTGAAVLLQLWLSLRLGTASGQGWEHGLLMYLGYFTVLTNLLVMVVALRGAGALDGGRDHPWRGAAVTSIVVVGLAYHLLLRKVWDPQGLQLVADILLHYAVPLATLAWWLALPPLKRFAPRQPLLWLAWPLGYCVYALLRGSIIGSYPYYFIDAGVIGMPRALLNSAGLGIVFAAVAYAVWGVARLRQRRAKGA